MRIEKSFKAYKVGEMDKTTFIEIAIKNIGTKFINIFLEQLSYVYRDTSTVLLDNASFIEINLEYGY